MDIQQHKKIILCKLCCQPFETNYKLIDDGTIKMLALLLIKHDPNEGQSMICHKCSDKLKTCFEFKSSCLSKKDVCSFDSEKDNVKSFTPIKEECQSKDNVCHLCKSSLSHDSYTSLADDNNDVNLRVLLDTYFPELNHNGIQDLLLCMECRVSLEALFDAVSNWSNVQVNVRGNETVPHIVTKYCPDLNNTPQFQPKLEHNNISFDTENVFFEHEFKFSDCLLPTETSGFAKLERQEFSIKHEETDLKIGLDHYKSLEEYTIYPSQLEEIKKTGRTMCQQDFSDIPNVHKTIQGVTIFTCKICGFKTRVKWKFERHMVTHLYPSEETVYRCDKCEYKTKHNKSTLKRHMLIHEDPSEVTMFVCDRCEYKTKNKVNLRRHIVTHQDLSESAMYHCDKCEYKTKYKYDVKRHMVTHQDVCEDTLYRCEKCEHKTIHKRALRRHMVIHLDPSEITMYQCDKCEYRAKQKYNLLAHMKTHQDISEIINYKCTRCEYNTKHKRSLTRHVATQHDYAKVTV